MQETALPYGEIFYELLMCVHEGLKCCYDAKKSNKELEEVAPALLEIFANFERRYKFGTNKHVSQGFSRKALKQRLVPRLVSLTIQGFAESQRIAKSRNFQGLVLPSPFLIIYQSLTVPDEPQSAAYSLVLCRSMLFYFLGLHPKHPELPKFSGLDAFEEYNVLESIASFRNHIHIQLRWPDKRMTDGVRGRVNFLTGHFLSLKGYSYFWFSEEKELEDFCKVSHKDIGKIKLKYKTPSYRFRLSDNYVDLPEPGEVINSLFGVPLPIRGGETLFFGGVKKTANGGCVINLSGKPGAGKTSICLSIAALMSPLNTKCIYISLEEEKEDLYTRLITLIPEYLKDLSIYQKPKGVDNTEWFVPLRIKDNIGFSQITDILILLNEDIRKASVLPSEHSNILPSVCPLLIVLDNINEFASGYKEGEEGYKEIDDFVSACRKMGAIVILISANELEQKLKIDYLVDVAINIRQLGTDNRLEKPVRVFQLNKTRNQISRQGSHIFHLSAPSGFRICPQIPSQMDRKENLKRLLPDKSKCIHGLNLVNGDFNYYLQIFPISHILIHGIGSSGKAGFALKLLLSPPVPRPEMLHGKQIAGDERIKEMYNDVYRDQLLKNKFSSASFQRKVLIVSFLYPEEYYSALVSDKMHLELRSTYKELRSPKVKILPFYPGFLAVEDFISKIVRHLDEAILEGEPYTGVLLDGLHNVFLQFKNLQDNDMVWPLLYGILSRYNVTVVSTFTNFSVNNHQESEAKFTNIIDDQRIMLKGQAPFLHSLVKASDFYLTLDERFDNHGQRRYIIKVRSSIDQRPPMEILEWDRQRFQIINHGTEEGVLGMTEIKPN